MLRDSEKSLSRAADMVIKQEKRVDLAIISVVSEQEGQRAAIALRQTDQTLEDLGIINLDLQKDPNLTVIAMLESAALVIAKCLKKAEHRDLSNLMPTEPLQEGLVANAPLLVLEVMVKEALAQHLVLGAHLTEIVDVLDLVEDQTARAKIFLHHIDS